jgi:hypothetical protein
LDGLGWPETARGGTNNEDIYIDKGGGGYFLSLNQPGVGVGLQAGFNSLSDLCGVAEDGIVHNEYFHCAPFA